MSIAFKIQVNSGIILFIDCITENGIKKKYAFYFKKVKLQLKYKKNCIGAVYRESTVND